MPHALDRPVDRRARPAAVRAFAGAVLMLSLGVASSATAQNRPAQTQPPAEQKSGAVQTTGNPVEAQLADFKKRLNITAAQQSQFDRFADTVKQNAQEMEALMRKEMQSARQNAVEGLRTAASLAQTEADNLKRLVPALEALYASLSEQQKRTADQLFSTASPSDAPPQRGQGRRPG